MSRASIPLLPLWAVRTVQVYTLPFTFYISTAHIRGQLRVAAFNNKGEFSDKITTLHKIIYHLATHSFFQLTGQKKNLEIW